MGLASPSLNKKSKTLSTYTVDYCVTFGLCCICLKLKEREIRFRKANFSNIAKLDAVSVFEKLQEIWLHNSKVLKETVEFCAKSGFGNYRISSDIFPLATHPKLKNAFFESVSFPAIKRLLKETGLLAKNNGLGFSFHPSQFVVLASGNPAVRTSAASEINFNSEILDMLGAPVSPSAPINVHLNTRPRNDLARDFENGLDLLSPNARARLTVENEDRGFWNVANLLSFLRRFDIPLTLDFLHHKCNNMGEVLSDVFDAAAKTWGGNIPVFHYSESRSPRCPRAHSDYCKKLPPYFGAAYICQIEAKMKDLAILRLMRKLQKAQMQ